MLHVDETQRLRDQLLSFIPRYGYKDGIRVDDGRYKELMMCRLRPAYTKEDICQAVNYLWRLLLQIAHTTAATNLVS